MTEPSNAKLLAIRDQVHRYFVAVHGVDYGYRAPETYDNLLERWLLVLLDDVDYASDLMGRIEELARERS